MRAAIAALLLLMGGCDQVGADGYSFERKEFTRLRVVVDLVLHPSYEDLNRRIPKNAIRDPDHPERGWAIPRANGTCEMHVLDPDVRHDPEWHGHEFDHCAFGDFHPSVTKAIAAKNRARRP